MPPGGLDAPMAPPHHQYVDWVGRTRDEEPATGSLPSCVAPPGARPTCFSVSLQADAGGPRGGAHGAAAPGVLRSATIWRTSRLRSARSNGLFRNGARVSSRNLCL